MTDPIAVDGHLMSSLRLAASVTISQVAHLIGVRPIVIRRLEVSDDKACVQRSPSGWRIRVLDVLAAADQMRLMATLQCEVHGLNRAVTREMHRLVHPPPTNAIGGSVMSQTRVKRLSLLERVAAITIDGSGYGPSPNLRYALDV
jgi:hypothetical protein